VLHTGSQHTAASAQGTVERRSRRAIMWSLLLHKPLLLLAYYVVQGTVGRSCAHHTATNESVAPATGAACSLVTTAPTPAPPEAAAVEISLHSAVLHHAGGPHYASLTSILTATPVAPVQLLVADAAAAGQAIVKGDRTAPQLK
jgi:hypothetical protein